MSWDIFVQDLPPGIGSVGEIPNDFRPQVITTREEVLQAVREVQPQAAVSDPSWESIDGADWSVEVNLGDDGPLKSFAFHVRGSEEAAYVVHEVLERLGLRALDPSNESGIVQEEKVSGKKRCQDGFS